ncbi:hypothetical protein RF11_09937 [Thelohanellus kitauei]|uniref:Uncharacterized protein n=1 Tax=Thelohanellus kitauei TaxID=669202 RepID=A0A0C2MI29_THEKT|nr:hypothetical protein RF11_09937 [Thelohanellus kitauei]
MKIVMKFRDRSNSSNVWTEIQVYHLKYYSQFCEKTMDINDGNHINTEIEFKIFLSVGDTVNYFTKYHFFLMNKPENDTYSIDDLYHIANLFVNLRPTGSNVILRANSQINMDKMTSEASSKKSLCIYFTHLNKKIKVKYIDSTESERKMSHSVVLMIEIRNGSAFSSNELLFKTQLSGWRADCFTRFKNPFQLPSLYYDGRWNNVIIRFMMIDVFFRTIETTAVNVTGNTWRYTHIQDFKFVFIGIHNLRFNISNYQKTDQNIHKINSLLLVRSEIKHYICKIDESTVLLTEYVFNGMPIDDTFITPVTYGINGELKVFELFYHVNKDACRKKSNRKRFE